MASSLSSRDKAVIWHPYTQHKNNIPPIPITRATGTLLYDEDDRSYIDAISSWWVTIHGHAHPYIAEKIYEQAKLLEQVIFTGFTHEPAVLLAERLLKILPGNLSKIFYSDNGSTAVEVAIKMAIQFWNNQDGSSRRKKILAFRNAYHGDTFGAMSVSDRGVFTLPFHDFLFEVIVIDTPHNGNIQALQSLIISKSDEICCFIYEPLLQAAGGMKMYDAIMLDELLKTVQAQDILCIADEVMTGFGRTGKLFAGEYLTTKPDIICLSKGLTGGSMALGVTASSEKIYEAFLSDERQKTFFHGHSFTANPIACAAANASLDLVGKENFLKQITGIADHHRLFIAQWKGNNPAHQIKAIRQLGTVVAFEIESGSDGYLNNISMQITQRALKNGIYLRPLGNTVYLMPPYCITKAELDQLSDFLLTQLFS